LTASATCPGTPTYRFLVGSTVVQAYSTTNTFSWNTTGLGYGTYNVEVDVRDQGASAGYEAWAIIRYSLTPCSSAGLMTDKSSPQGTGANTIVLTATASCLGTPEYRFLVNGAIVQAYGTTNTFSWNTSGRPAGTYSLEVDVRNQGSTLGYETYAIRSFTLAGCTAATLSATPSGSAKTGTTVTLTATATCPGTPEYRFLVGSTVVQAYSTTNTFAWDTTGRTAGGYQLEVDVRDQGSGSGYEAWSIITYTLTP
jgi:P2-related tail formation protein